MDSTLLAKLNGFLEMVWTSEQIRSCKLDGGALDMKVFFFGFDEQVCALSLITPLQIRFGIKPVVYNCTLKAAYCYN